MLQGVHPLSLHVFPKTEDGYLAEFQVNLSEGFPMSIAKQLRVPRSARGVLLLLSPQRQQICNSNVGQIFRLALSILLTLAQVILNLLSRGDFRKLGNSLNLDISLSWGTHQIWSFPKLEKHQLQNDQTKLQLNIIMVHYPDQEKNISELLYTVLMVFILSIQLFLV